MLQICDSVPVKQNKSVDDQTPREIAAHILLQRERRFRYLDRLLEQRLSQAALSAPDRHLIQELTYGVARWQRLLDWLIERKTPGRSVKLTARVLLRLGLYQLFWLDRIPAHAALHETVAVSKRLGHRSLAGFINAVLRGYLRERDATLKRLEGLKASHPALGHSHPDWLWERWRQRWGDDSARRLMEWNNQPPPTYARANRLRTAPPALLGRWETEGVVAATHLWDWTGPEPIFELTSHPPLTEMGSFREGWFAVQDPSTLLAVELLAPDPADSVLDLCAAPGGKTALLAQRMQNRGTIVAHDVSAGRRQQLQTTLSRLGVECAETTDCTELPPRKRFYHGVLVDAPCSNTGVMRRRVDVRWRLTPKELVQLQREQIDLLRAVADQIRPGGALVYSTCSLEPEENREVVDHFLREHGDYRLAEVRELTPFADGVDGAFAAKLIRLAGG